MTQPGGQRGIGYGTQGRPLPVSVLLLQVQPDGRRTSEGIRLAAGLGELEVARYVVPLAHPAVRAPNDRLLALSADLHLPAMA